MTSRILDDMFAAFTENIVGIVVLGATKQKILKAAADAGYPACRIKTADTFEQAVQSARQMAPKGGAVLLSPACASWAIQPGGSAAWAATVWGVLY